jgi:hypothetical protein
MKEIITLFTTVLVALVLALIGKTIETALKLSLAFANTPKNIITISFILPRYMFKALHIIHKKNNRIRGCTQFAAALNSRLHSI